MFMVINHDEFYLHGRGEINKKTEPNELKNNTKKIPPPPLKYTKISDPEQFLPRSRLKPLERELNQNKNSYY